MTEEKKNRNNSKEQITFYETFDDEIVRINRQVSLTPTDGIGSPRLSYAPTPVIPGFYTLSDAFENGRRRLAAEEDSATDSEKTQETRIHEIVETERSTQFGNSMIRAVTPGQFEGRSGLRHITISAGVGKRPVRTQAEARLKSEINPNPKKHYIPAGKLIEELTDDEIVSEPFYSDEQRVRQSQCFDFILDETMRSLIEEQEQTKVKLG